MRNLILPGVAAKIKERDRCQVIAMQIQLRQNQPYDVTMPKIVYNQNN